MLNFDTLKIQFVVDEVIDFQNVEYLRELIDTKTNRRTYELKSIPSIAGIVSFKAIQDKNSLTDEYFETSITMELSAKTLGKRYLEGINFHTEYDCWDYINFHLFNSQLEHHYFENATVLRSDTFVNIQLTQEERNSLYSSLLQTPFDKAYKHHIEGTAKAGRTFYIQSKQAQLKIYEKELELQLAKNRNIRSLVTQDITGLTRIELRLTNFESIRQYMGIKPKGNVLVHELLNAKGTPISTYLMQVMKTKNKQIDAKTTDEQFVKFVLELKNYQVKQVRNYFLSLDDVSQQTWQRRWKPIVDNLLRERVKNSTSFQKLAKEIEQIEWNAELPEWNLELPEWNVEIPEWELVEV